MTTIYRRYVDDPNTMEKELHARSGQPVDLIGLPFDIDPDEGTIMQRIRFADGYETDAFEDELHEETAEQIADRILARLDTSILRDYDMDALSVSDVRTALREAVHARHPEESVKESNMHDLNTIKHLNREELNRFKGTAEEFRDSTPIHRDMLRGTPPVGATPTTSHDALIASVVNGRKERWSHPPLFRMVMESYPSLLYFARALSLKDAWEEHMLKRKPSLREALNVREYSSNQWLHLDEDSDLL